MSYEFDPAKDKLNQVKHGVSLGNSEGFEWETAVIREDTRKQYAEPRFEAIGLIADRLHVMIYCFRAGAVRVISLRKANNREKRDYVSDD